MSRWQDAYDAQIDLGRLWASLDGYNYAKGWVDSVRRKMEAAVGISLEGMTKTELDLMRFAGYQSDDQTEYQKWRVEQSISNYLNLLGQTAGADDDPVQGLIRIERSKAALADPIYVSGEMLDLAEAAMPTFVPEPLQPTDLMTPRGVMLLPRSISFLDGAMKRASFRLISWLPVQTEDGKEGVSISLYSYLPDVLNPEIDDYAEEYTEALVERMPAWGMLHTAPWMFGDAVPDQFADGHGWWGQLQVLFRLSMQYISDRTQMRPDRAVRKRAAREGFDPDKYVTVLTLRRPRSKSDKEPSHVEWQHRWVVGGHWRNQWYPSLNAHRQVWIAPYIKGPEDKELRVRKLRAFEVVR